MTRALFLLFLWPFCAISAQDSLSIRQPGIPRLTLKTNATTLLNAAKTSAMLTADLRLAPRWSVDIGAGSFLFSSFFAENPGEHYYGLRARAGMKYFFSLRPNASWHLGIEAKYNDVQHAYWERLLRQGGQFEQTMLIDRTVKSIGAALRTGWTPSIHLTPSALHRGIGYSEIEILPCFMCRKYCARRPCLKNTWKKP